MSRCVDAWWDGDGRQGEKSLELTARAVVRSLEMTARLALGLRMSVFRRRRAIESKGSGISKGVLSSDSHGQSLASTVLYVPYRGISLIRNRPTLAIYSGFVYRALWWS